MTTPAEAEAAIAANMPASGSENLPLAAVAGRVLARRAHADRDQPPFDRVTMDGIALRYEDYASGQRQFRIAGTIAAGASRAPATPAGDCVEIMTGAVLPDELDTVVPVERTQKQDDMVTISNDAQIVAGQFVHRQGSDLNAGDTLLAAGALLGPPEVAVLASAGHAGIEVAKLARVAVISTGDELVGPDEPVLPHQIRSTNDFAIAAALERHCLATVSRHRLRDDEAALRENIARLHETHDSLILSGGVSMGHFDFVPTVLDALGCELVFHRIEQKPGRPMWFGVSRDGKPIFALPGNPVSTLLCLTRYVVPAFRKAAGMTLPAPHRYALSGKVAAPPRLTYFVPVVLTVDADGATVAAPHPTNTSGDFATLAGTDGFLELPPGRSEHPPGSTGAFFPW